MTDHQHAFTTNMSRLHGWTSATIKNLSFELSMEHITPGGAANKLRELYELMDTIWAANGENRIVDLSEYSNPPKKAHS